MRDTFERHQVWLYLGSVALALAVALAWPSNGSWESWINASLALMLFVTFLQVPIARLGQAFRQTRFLAALMVANFIAIPLLVALLIQFLPDSPLLVLAVLFVLLTPCIDYVVTFTHLGRGDATSLLAATPLLLVVQMLLLPVYLRLIVDAEAAQVVDVQPFLHAFLTLIVAPLGLAAIAQVLARSSAVAGKVVDIFSIFPVPATALVLFIVVCAVVPQLGPALDSVLLAMPVYVAFAVLAPAVGWFVARGFGLAAGPSRGVAFSAGTRNSLVVLPLALAVPGAVPIIPAVIVAQTLIELLSELVYIRVMPRLGVMKMVVTQA